MLKRILKIELKKAGYNERSIRDYFRHCRIYKYEVSFEGFMKYIYELSRIIKY